MDVLFDDARTCRSRVEGPARAGAYPGPFEQRSPLDDPSGIRSEVRLHSVAVLHAMCEPGADLTRCRQGKGIRFSAKEGCEIVRVVSVRCVWFRPVAVPNAWAVQMESRVKTGGDHVLSEDRPHSRAWRTAFLLLGHVPHNPYPAHSAPFCLRATLLRAHSPLPCSFRPTLHARNALSLCLSLSFVC